MRHFKSFLFILSALLIFLLNSGYLSAKNKYALWINSESYSQLRKNTLDENEWPFLEYLSAGISPGEVMDFDFSLKIMGDPLRERSRVDIYSTRVVLNNLGDLITISMGRQNFAGNFSYDLADGLNIVVNPSLPVSFEAYAGFLRYIEFDEFRDYNFVAGSKVFLNGVENTALSAEFRYEKIENGGDWVEVGFIAAQEFSVPSNPKLDVGFNFDATNSLIQQANLGISLKPHSIFELNLEATRYNFKDNFFDLSNPYPFEYIFSIFSLGPLWNFEESTGLHITRDLTIFQGASINIYDYDINSNDPGYSLRAGFYYTGFQRRLNCTSTFFFDKSYGGEAIGVNGTGKLKILERLWTALKVGFVRFDKVSGETDNASAVALSLGYRIIKGMEAILGGEFNSNDDFKRDFRANLTVKYEFF